MALHGVVEWYNPERAYGFIHTSDGRTLFVHRSALVDGRLWLVAGQQVTLRTRQGRKGIEADAVRVVGEAAIDPDQARRYRSEARRQDWAQRQQCPPAQAAPRRRRTPRPACASSTRTCAQSTDE